MKDELSDAVARAVRHGFTVRFTPHECQHFGVEVRGTLNNGEMITNGRKLSDLELSTSRFDLFTITVDKLVEDTIAKLEKDES